MLRFRVDLIGLSKLKRLLQDTSSPQYKICSLGFNYLNGHTSPTRKTCYRHSDSGGDEQPQKKQTNKKQRVVVGGGFLLQAESLLLNIVHRQTKEMNSVEFTRVISLRHPWVRCWTRHKMNFYSRLL